MEQLADALARSRDLLVGFVGKHAGWLLHFEGAEDLTQGVHLRALETADRFEWRGEEAFRAWMLTVARQHLAARAGHWRALKRDGGKMLRLASSSGDSASGFDPSASWTGPITFAVRREMLAVAAQALETLSARDREFVHGKLDGQPVDRMATRLGISYDAAQRGALRAMDRFRTSFELLASERDGGV